MKNAIHRLIMPELETLKPEQKIQQSRQDFDRGRSSDSPFERRSDCAICVEDVTSDEEKFFEKRSKEHRVKDGEESFTAWLLNRPNMRHNDSRSSTDREKRRRRRSKGGPRVSQAFQKAEGGSQ